VASAEKENPKQKKERKEKKADLLTYVGMYPLSGVMGDDGTMGLLDNFE
jgi:hypothetical protein